MQSLVAVSETNVDVNVAPSPAASEHQRKAANAQREKQAEQWFVREEREYADVVGKQVPARDFFFPLQICIVQPDVTV
jgi:hypothetical protein